MKFQLLDFQIVATDQLISEVKKAQSRYDNDPELLGAVVLEAATGAGKTVIATSMLEQLFFGSDTTEPVEGTTVLWVTNDPSLNAQTARKMQEASERINDIRFIGQGAYFDEESFSPGVIYFLNTQAASISGRITKRSDSQSFTIWETISNTVDKLGSRFLVVVDEAHYGVTEKPGGSQTVVNKIANSARPIPVFIGISATADRLNKALESQERFKKNVVVPIEQVRDSGLVKDRIALLPAATQGGVIADTTFVRLGVQQTLDYSRRWMAYTEAQGEAPVKPALVVQLPDQKADDGEFRALLTSVIDAVTEEWPGLIAAHIVHTFAEHAPIDLGAGRAIRYMAPQDIQDATEVRVILAKNAITTGWDCPRAEVLVSLRSSSDYTPVAQLIGRIVRQPLARRISSDETLNRVHAYLPKFDQHTVMQVVSQFAGGAVASTAQVTRLSLDYVSPPHLEPALAVLAGLPSYQVPSQTLSSETRRLHTLATLLENDGIRSAATGQARNYLNAKLDNEVDKLAAGGELEQMRAAVSSASIFELSTSIDGSIIDGERILTGTLLDTKNVDDVFKRASRALKDGTAEEYWAHLVGEDSQDPVEAKITVSALAASPLVIENIEMAAASLTHDWLKTAAKAVSYLPEASREKYARIQAQAKEPQQALGIVVNGTIEDSLSIAFWPELNDDDVRLEIAGDVKNRWPSHLYQDVADGLYWKKPTPTDGLERRVLETEISSSGFFAWYRNPVGGDRALCIPYRDSGTGRWSRLFPDFIVFHAVEGQVRASIIDPHGIQLEDWADKLRGYCDYADRHAPHFRAISPLTQIDGKILMLAIHDHKLRAEVRADLESGLSVEAIFRHRGINY